MFGDAATGAWGFNALAHLNPLRWSGPITFGKGIADLEAVLGHGDRPISVKIPANSLSQKDFKSVQEAIDYLRQEDPKVKAEADEKRRQEELAAAKDKADKIDALKGIADDAQTEAREQENDVKMKNDEEAKAKLDAEKAEKDHAAKVEAAEIAKGVTGECLEAFRASPSEVKTEWMYADAGISLTVAKLDPFRWSGGKPVDEIMTQLEELVVKKEARPILVRTPPGLQGKETTLGSPQAAIDHVCGLCSVKKPLWDKLAAAKQDFAAKEKQATDAREAVQAAHKNATDASERAEAAKAELVSPKEKAETANAALKAAEAE